MSVPYRGEQNLFHHSAFSTKVGVFCVRNFLRVIQKSLLERRLKINNSNFAHHTLRILPTPEYSKKQCCLKWLAGWDGRMLSFIANLMKVPRNFIPGTLMLGWNSSYLTFFFCCWRLVTPVCFSSMIATSISSMWAQSSMSFLMSFWSRSNYSSEALFAKMSDLCNRNITWKHQYLILALFWNIWPQSLLKWVA